MSALFQLHIPKNEIRVRHDIYIQGAPDEAEYFCTLTVWPKDEPNKVTLFFRTVEDVTHFGNAVCRLANDFAEKCGPDEAVVPIGAEAGTLTAKCLLCGIGTYPETGSGPCSNLKCQGYSEVDEGPATGPMSLDEATRNYVQATIDNLGESAR